MTKIEISSDMGVTLVRTNATDEFHIQMAQASLGADKTWTKDPKIDSQRFIRALMQPRHGVPFEHDIWTFFIEAPIFVARQWVKHRHASMNEMSGRYVKLKPKFYTVPSNRPVVNIGTHMKPQMIEASAISKLRLREQERAHFQTAWNLYENQIAKGFAEEVARIVLPVSIYTQFYWSVNSRALMSFLERRVESPANRVPTHPQWEIDKAARKVEAIFQEHTPLTHAAFVAAGRVAP